MGVFIESIDVTGLIMDDSFPTGIETISETSSAGSLIVYERSIEFFPINLIGGADFGWLTLSILNDLHDLSKIIGAVYTLDYEGTSYNVRFRNEDFPVVYGDKIINRSNQNVSDLYNNIILKLIGV